LARLWEENRDERVERVSLMCVILYSELFPPRERIKPNL